MFGPGQATSAVKQLVLIIKKIQRNLYLPRIPKVHTWHKCLLLIVLAELPMRSNCSSKYLPRIPKVHTSDKCLLLIVFGELPMRSKCSSKRKTAAYHSSRLSLGSRSLFLANIFKDLNSNLLSARVSRLRTKTGCVDTNKNKPDLGLDSKTRIHRNVGQQQ